MNVDAVDRQIILATQAGIPLHENPWEKVAEQLGIPESDVLERMERMKREGIIRRIAAVPNHYALGYRANGMSVWDIEDEAVERLGQKISELPFVSHCYERPRHVPEWSYNVFAMVHARTREEITPLVEQILSIVGSHCRGYEVLFSQRILKKTGVRLQG
ncbi:MAG: Lrp/AsnC family transcriptional regulator [SAR324 cluster bacterium]|nr:Lrp/AsnC family transcriptional regulator [SAR324 cluster bacterium]